MSINTEAFAIKNFGTLLTTLEDGALNADLSNDLEDVVSDLQDCIDRGVKRVITVSVAVTFTADRGVVEVGASYKIKRPDRTRRRTLMFVHAGRFLSKQDEKQPDLPLRVAEPTPQPLRNVE